MDANREQQLISEIESLITRRTTAMADAVRYEPTSSYLDGDRLAQERELFFTRYPLDVATSREVPEPGDFITSQIGGRPVLIVRGDDGKVRCLINICRHRGNVVCQQRRGNQRMFACEYHAWTYDRQGQLRSTVDRDGFAGLPREEFGLLELPTDERHGLVWTVPEPGAKLDVDAYLGADMSRELGDLRLAEMEVFRSDVIEQPFNWKLAADTFLEVFHLAHLHKKTVGPFFLGNLGAYHEWGLHHRYSAVRKSFATMSAGPEADRTIFPHSSLVHFIFPNNIVTWQMDHVETWRFYPSAQRDDACRVEGVMLIPEPATSEKAQRYWTKNWDLLMATIEDEDFLTMQRVQRNMETGVLPELAFGRNEVALQHFHQALTEELAAQRRGTSGPRS
jgi:phenylpropionate dioxygenase-like ring-hydroxylating dioxygenase large terminal subunit